jgi:hypothetical protein
MVVSPRSTDARKSPERLRSLASSTVLPSTAPPGSTIISTLKRRPSSSISVRAERRSGSTLGASRITSTTPTRAIGRPSLPISKNPISRSSRLFICPETTRFVEVPMTVIRPPSTAANDTGMRSLETETPRRFAHAVTCGMSIATIGVLFRKADAPRVGISVRIRGSRYRPFSPSVLCMIGVNAPVFSMPAAST